MYRFRLAAVSKRPPAPAIAGHRSFRSPAALESVRSLIDSGEEMEAQTGSTLALYNYPSFSGAFAALFAHLFHSKLELPFLALPFSSVEPFRVEDFKGGGIETCYLLDFIGPKDFAPELSRYIPRVIGFDHRKSTLARVSQLGRAPPNLELHIDTEKCSARAVCDYFSTKLIETDYHSGEIKSLFNQKEEEERVKNLINYIEDGDLRKWKLPDMKEFSFGIRDLRAKLNCISNPHVFKQLLEIDANDLINKGRLYVSSRQDSANKLVENPFKIQLGRGEFGECLAIRADGNSDLSHEIGLELSKRSAAAGLRPIGAIVYAQRANLKMCLRSTDSATDTSEIAKAYGGGGKASSSSFTIRMDEYNLWTKVNSLSSSRS